MSLDGSTTMQFYDMAQKFDFSRDFQFRIVDVGPELAQRYFGEGFQLKDLLNTYLMSSNIPGRSISDQPVDYMGHKFHVPGTATYDDQWAFTVREPQNLALRDIIERWQFDIYDDRTSTGHYHPVCPDNWFAVGLLNNRGECIRKYTLVGVYPQSIEGAKYTITGSGAPVDWNITFMYQYWRVSSGVTQPDSLDRGINAQRTNDFGVTAPVACSTHPNDADFQ